MISIISVIIIHCFISSTDISIFNAIIFTGFTINVIDALFPSWSNYYIICREYFNQYYLVLQGFKMVSKILK